jgi:hypothetical protein
MKNSILKKFRASRIDLLSGCADTYIKVGNFIGILGSSR